MRLGDFNVHCALCRGAQYRVKRVVDVLNFVGGVLETLVMEVHVRESEPMYVLNMYSPNKNVTVEKMEFYLSKLGNRFLVIGDLNAHSPVLDSTVRYSNPTGRTVENLVLMIE